MTREQLETLGDAGLRNLAQRVGLRGALYHCRELLITGLAAYFARRPRADDTDCDAPRDDAPEDEPAMGAADIPPALTTETMARLLESAGRTVQASALRARLAGEPPPASCRPSVRATPTASSGVDLHWEGAAGPGAALAVRLWAGDGQPTQREVPITTSEGHMHFEVPPEAHRLCVALGTLRAAGFVPAARSAVILLTRQDPGRAP